MLKKALYLKSEFEEDRQTKKRSEYGQYIIFYSGHGKIVEGETMGIDKNGEDIKIEFFVTKIGSK